MKENIINGKGRFQLDYKLKQVSKNWDLSRKERRAKTPVMRKINKSVVTQIKPQNWSSCQKGEKEKETFDEEQKK